jgi:hypothetical protein
LIQAEFRIATTSLAWRARMDVQALRQLKPELEGFLERYAPHFGRDEAQDHAHRFVQGLLLGGEPRRAHLDY